MPAAQECWVGSVFVCAWGWFGVLRWFRNMVLRDGPSGCTWGWVLVPGTWHCPTRTYLWPGTVSGRGTRSLPCGSPSQGGAVGCAKCQEQCGGAGTALM